jgi:hypothetical protein
MAVSMIPKKVAKVARPFSIPEALAAFEEKYFPNGLQPEQMELVEDVRQVASDAFSAGYSAAEIFTSERWSNSACLGYAILAARAMKMSEKEIARLVRTMNGLYDFHSIEEAKAVYERSPY